MVRVYEVYCDKEFLGTFKADTADDAVRQASGQKSQKNSKSIYKATEIYSSFNFLDKIRK
tara:strand:- start:14 stop:193 length:180 start_codon:yes stop_codon:yes gene_type:complete